MKIYGKNMVEKYMNIFEDVHDDIHGVLGKNMKKWYVLVVKS